MYLTRKQMYNRRRINYQLIDYNRCLALDKILQRLGIWEQVVDDMNWWGRERARLRGIEYKPRTVSDVRKEISAMVSKGSIGNAYYGKDNRFSNVIANSARAVILLPAMISRIRKYKPNDACVHRVKMVFEDELEAKIAEINAACAIDVAWGAEQTNKKLKCEAGTF